MAETAERGTSPPVWLLLAAGCAISLASFGVRAIFGLYTEPLTALRGWGRETFSLAIAVQNLAWGLFQPVAGALGDRFGPAATMAGSALVFAAGAVLAGLADSPPLFLLGAGLMVGMGLAGASFHMVNAAFGRILPLARLSLAMGLATAAASAGQFVYAPLTRELIAAFGPETSLALLGLSLLVIVPLSALFAGAGGAGARGSEVPPLSRVLGTALRHRSYVLLVSGFFVCGFHVAFISTHWPADLVDRGVDPAVAAWALGLIGLFNILGSLGSGWLGQHLPKRTILCWIYALRALVFALHLLLPPTPLLTLAFGAAIGLLWLATVAPTSGLVAAMFGTRDLGTLFGIVFLGHQLGAFLGVWLGGAFYDRFGSYEPVWWTAIALGLLATALHWPIRERAVRIAPAGGR